VEVDDSTIETTLTVSGTAPIDSVDLFRGTERVAAEPITETDPASNTIQFCWSGIGSKDRHKICDWNGGLMLDSGKITKVDPFGFDHPESGVKSVTDTTVRWESTTSGNYQGIRVTVDAPNDASLSFSTPPVSTSVSFGDLNKERTVPGEAFDQSLEIRPLASSTTRDVTLAFEDDAPSGIHPYFVRVRQADGGMAWSSPVFVTV
jgi:hypothetical protein